MSNLPAYPLPKTPAHLRQTLDRLAKNQTLPSGGGVVELAGYVQDEAQADSNLAVAQIVYVAATGNIDLAQADSATTFRAAGVVLTAATSGSTTVYQKIGICPGFSSLTPGTMYYLSADTAGAIVSTPDATAGEYIVPVGVAVSATELCFLPLTPILL